MKRQALSIGLSMVIWPAWMSWAAAQTAPVNPLRPAVASRAADESTEETVGVDQGKTALSPEAESTSPAPAAKPAAREPRPIRAADARPMRSIPRGEPRRTMRGSPSASPSPFQLLQYGVRVHQGRGGGRFASRLTQPPSTTPAPQASEAPQLLSPETVIDEGPTIPGSDCCGGAGCAECLGNPCGGIQCPSLRNFEFFVGTQGFTNATNRGETGSFGFNYGFNWGAPLYCLTNGEIGMQAGFRGVTSNFDGASYTTETRNQYFITAGLFRRVDYGLQGGVVFDYLGESWYYNADMKQIRGEISWMFPACHELGFWFAARGNDTQNVSNVLQDGNMVQLDERLVPVTQYRFFYRRRFEDCGAEGRLSAGWTSNGDGIVGADFQLPISNRWALEATFTYLIPEGDAASGAYANEAWNVAFGLVWYPGIRNARNNDYFRPLFDVADNGSFILRR